LLFSVLALSAASYSVCPQAIQLSTFSRYWSSELSQLRLEFFRPAAPHRWIQLVLSAPIDSKWQRAKLVASPLC